MLDEARDYLSGYLGKLSDKEKEEVYSEISSGTRPSREFFIMLVISSVIATVGLLTNSVAAIIGAMLVSPLLIPVIGISLGAVRGDLGLFRSGIEAELKGIAIVIVLVVFITLIVPSAGVTSEILLRTQPTPLDLLIALASGAAAAYALSKKSIGATLPGVAIAVAVLPPLCVAGIGLALKAPEVAVGGALTFLANVVAINFAALVMFWLLGFSAQWSMKGDEQAVRQIKTSAALLLLISLPLAWIMWNSISTADAQAKIEQVLSSQVAGIEEARLVGAEFSYGKGGAVVVSASIDSPREITQEKADEMEVALEKSLGADVELLVKVNRIILVRP